MRTSTAERWRSFPNRHANDNVDPPISPERDASLAENAPDNIEMPARSAYVEAVKDALQANPAGLRTKEVIKWLRTNRPHIFLQGEEEQVKTSLRVALSRQANQKNSAILKHKAPESSTPGYIWILDRTAIDVESSTDRIPMLPLNKDATAHTRATSISRPPDQERPAGRNHSTASNGCQTSMIESSSVSRSCTVDSLLMDNRSTEHEGVGRETIVVATETSARGTPYEIFEKSDMSSTQPLDIGEQYHSDSHQPSNAGADLRVGNGPAPQRQDSVATMPERGIGEIQAHNMSPEDRIALQFGKDVVAIRLMKSKRRLMEIELESEQRYLPDIAAMMGDAESREKAVQELIVKLAEARKIADEASAALRDATQHQADVAAKSHKLAKLDDEIEERRLALDIG